MTAVVLQEGVTMREATYQVEEDVNSLAVGGLSSLFKALCGLKFGQGDSPACIVDFSVTRSSLEQVFVMFAKHQIE